MSITDSIKALTSPREPIGKVHVVDPSPLNWLYITYNTVEELVRMDENGSIQPAAMKSYRWSDDRTLTRSARSRHATGHAGLDRGGMGTRLGPDGED